MTVENKESHLKTKDKFQIIDITEEVKNIVDKSGVKTGIITITTKHTTSSIRVNENETRLLEDIKKFLEETAPDGQPYLHDDIDQRRDCPKDEPKNAHAHLKALIMGASESLPIKDGQLSLGKWQKIFFFELDGPRDRTYTTTVIGE